MQCEYTNEEAILKFETFKGFKKQFSCGTAN
jgi:hypothetical protein